MRATVPVDLSFLLAKIHGMRSRVYEDERLARLLGSRNVLELMRSLRPNEELISHRQFERVLITDHVGELERLARYLEQPFAEAFAAFLRRYQVENAKVILRGWARRLTPEEVAEHVVDLPEDLGLPQRELMAAHDLEGFLGLLPGDLAAGAALGRDHFLRLGGTYFLEVGLDRTWMGQLLTAADALAEPHRRAVCDMVNLEVDQYQVLLVLRGKVNYGIDLDELRPFLLSGPELRVKEEELEALSVAGDLAAMLAALPQRRWLEGRRGDVGDPAGSIEELQDRFLRRLYRRANWHYYHSVLDLGAVFAFAYLKRTELANLIILTEALRYDIPRPEIAGRLVGRSEEA